MIDSIKKLPLFSNGFSLCAFLLGCLILSSEYRQFSEANRYLIVSIAMGFFFLSFLCYDWRDFLCLLLAFSSLTMTDFGILSAIPGMNLVNLAFCIFLAAIIIWKRNLGIVAGRRELINVFCLIGLVIGYRVISTLRVCPEQLMPESFGMLRNVLLLFCAYAAASESMKEQTSVEEMLGWLRQTYTILFLLLIFQCVILSLNSSDIEFKYNFSLKTDTVAFNDLRNSMGLAAAGVARVAGLSLLFCVFMLLEKGSRWWSIPLAGICGYCLLLSFTKTGQLGVALSLVLILGATKHYWKLLQLIAGGALALAFIPDYFWVRIFEVVDNSEIIAGGDASRFDMAITPLSYMMPSDYFFGLGTYGYLVDYGGMSLFRAHNGITEAVLEGGAIGFGLMTMLWFLSGKKILPLMLRLNHESRNYQPLLMLPSAIWLFMLIFFVNGGVFLTSGSGALFMINWGLILGFRAALEKLPSSSLGLNKRTPANNRQTPGAINVNDAARENL